nr:AP2/ERF family transcription factor [Paracoccus methylarcula]
MFDDDSEYGIYRFEAHGHHGAKWRVSLSRQGHQIERTFCDSLYGSSMTCLIQARAYRDAVMAAIPPTTNHERVVRLRSDNQSGVSGVIFNEDDAHVSWIATFTSAKGRKSKRFSVKEHGNDQAKALAIAQRQEWLNAHPVNYVTFSPQAEEVARDRFKDRLETPANVLPHARLSKAEIKKRLASINARFDSLRPARLRVRGRRGTGGQVLTISVSDAGRPARRKDMNIKMKRRPLEVALMKAAEKIEATITNIYNADAARWFMDEHGQHLLDPASFDPEEGFSVLVFVPVDLLSVDSGECCQSRILS